MPTAARALPRVVRSCLVPLTHKMPALLLILTALVLAGLAVVAPIVASPTAFSAPASYQLPGGIVVYSSPSLADMDGDGVPEVLVGTTAQNGAPLFEGKPYTYDRPNVLAVLKGAGTSLWSKPVDAPIGSSPTVGDVNGDGLPELVVVSVGGDLNDPRHHGGLIAFDRSGNQLWRFTTQDFDTNGYADGVYSTPAICDVEGDGDLEIAFGAWDQRIYLLDHMGNSLWNNLPPGTSGPGYFNRDTVWSSPACVDLNRDGLREIVIGADIAGDPGNGGFVYVFDRSGQPLVRRFLPESIYSSPAIGDLDEDGDLEIVVGTSEYYWRRNGSRPLVYAFDTSQVFRALPYDSAGKLPDLPGWPQSTRFPALSSPALGDLDGDGDLEIVIGSGNPDLGDTDPSIAGAVYAWHHDGSPLAGWPVFPSNAEGKDLAIRSSPVIADVDADGALEILFSMIWDVQVYNANGTLQELLHTTWSIGGAPAVGDTNGNGMADVWIGTSNYRDPSNGYLWRFESDAPGYKPGPWPMFRANAAHTGVLGDRTTLPTPTVTPSATATAIPTSTSTPVAAATTTSTPDPNATATPTPGPLGHALDLPLILRGRLR